ncbi:RNB domain-containing ribonuclease [Arthrobacter sp. B1805]|uniref:RNB domain-containing ribonuclease n=1 Tax=Arthrobacter sp. B1805 TaxID=2058892 RepID=UPI002804276A|nr:RNB domain-containing ribonuclease [Arthrobacter sp. B1805]
MPAQHMDLRDRESQQRLTESLRTLREELGIREEFPEEVLREAEAVVHSHELPAADLRELPFLTIDPPGSTDLDQAVCLARSGTGGEGDSGNASEKASEKASDSGPGGYEVWYAIADVPLFVRAGGAIDAEARLRGQTMYAPDGRISLHPEVVSEHAASLLPEQDRPAFVWHFRLDADAVVQSVTVSRATVRSRRQLTYAQVQADIDAGTADEQLTLLEEIGSRRIQLELDRGGASLNLPRQEITHEGDSYGIITEPALPCEDWNAQISLMTGMAAARMMIDGGIGILRTMPEPDDGALGKFRRQSEALEHPWPEGMAYGAFLRTLDVTDPRQLALMHAAASLFRGAGYTAFDGALPDAVVQSAIAAPYAHTTAPLRRLVDRFVLVICSSLCAGEEVPAWVRSALPELNALMSSSNQTASRLDSGAMDAVQAALLSNRIGEAFSAVVLQGSPPAIEESPGKQAPRLSGTVQVTEPPLEAKCYGELVAGERVTVVLLEADIARRRLRFEVKPTDAPQRYPQ